MRHYYLGFTARVLSGEGLSARFCLGGGGGGGVGFGRFLGGRIGHGLIVLSGGGENPGWFVRGRQWTGFVLIIFPGGEGGICLGILSQGFCWGGGGGGCCRFFRNWVFWGGGIVRNERLGGERGLSGGWVFAGGMGFSGGRVCGGLGVWLGVVTEGGCRWWFVEEVGYRGGCVRIVG